MTSLHTRLLSLAVLIVVGTVGPAAGAPHTLEGTWRGFVSITPARLSPILARFEEKGGRWRGTVDVPGAVDVPTRTVTIEERRVRIEVDLDETVAIFSGDLENDEIRGMLSFDGAEYPFELLRLPVLPKPANRVEAWNQDLDAMVNQFLRYDRSFSGVARASFLSQIDRLRERLAALSEPEVIVALSRAVAISGNAHTRLYLLRNRTALRRLPIRAYRFRDGLFVVRAESEQRDLVGCRVTSIGGSDPVKLQERVATLFAGNEGWVQYKSPFFMTSPEILAGLGVIESMEAVPVGVACGDGQIVTHTLAPLPLARKDEPTEPWWDLAPFSTGDAADVTIPLYLRDPEKHYLFEYLESHQAVYFRYNRAKNMLEGESFDSFAQKLENFIRGHELERFIVDLRFNTGGDKEIASPFMERLAALEKNGQLGRLYVIIGRATFSAGISHAAQLKQFTQAIFVGEPVGDELDTWSEGGNIVLPNSGLTAHFTNGFHSLSRVKRPEFEPYLWTDLDIESLEPDVVVPWSSADYLAGRDPYLEAVLAMEP